MQSYVRAGRNNQIRVNELLRQRLLDSLGLSQLQLQQLAGLLGNDHIKHIARDKVQQLKEAHPIEHVCSVLARQVLQLQPALGFPAVPIPPAPQPVVIDPAVKQLVTAAIRAVGGKPAVEPVKKPSAAASAAADGQIDPAVKALVAAAVARAVSGGVDDEEDEDDNDKTEINGEDEHAGEEWNWIYEDACIH